MRFYPDGPKEPLFLWPIRVKNASEKKHFNATG